MLLKTILTALEGNVDDVLCRYVDAAKEWVSWVQASPKERRHFYQQRAQQESTQL
jgi:hypothetical protein